MAKARPTIGLDYGTHSTKIVHRIRDYEIGRIRRFDDSCDGYPVNASPSVIREIDERLYFGSEALRMRGGVNYGSLKADLLVDQSDEPELKERIDVLVAGYLSWVLVRLFEEDRSLAESDPIVQLSAPTSHLGDRRLTDRFLRIAHAAYRLATERQIEICQSLRYESLFEHAVPILQEDVPAKGKRPFFVMPETVAPIVSLQLEPYLDPGIRLVADMGAGTTEMSVFLVHNESRQSQILAYSDSTEGRGGDQINEIERRGHPDSTSLMKGFLKEVGRQARGVWYLGFRKDKENLAAKRIWMTLEVSLTGGATKHPGVREYFDNHSPIHAWPEGETSISIGRHAPTTLVCDPGYEESDLSLFATANGLSIEFAKWPKFFGEDEIPVLSGIDNTEELVPSYLEIG